MLSRSRTGRVARPWQALLAATVIAVALAACGGSTPDDADIDEGSDASEDAEDAGDGGDAAGEDTGAAAGPSGSLVLGTSLTLNTSDPDVLQNAGFTVLTNQLYDRLTQIGADGAAAPLLAASWEGGEDDEGAYLDMTLREGVTFSDGVPFNADSVAANFDRSQTLEGSQTALDVGGVTVEALSDLEVRLRKPDGVASLPLALAGPAGAMISQEAIDEGRDISTDPAGIGMFVLEQQDPTQWVMRAREDYWDPESQGVEELTIRILPNDARLNELRAGTLDIANVPGELAQEVGGDYELIEVRNQNNVYGLPINTSLEPMDDARVRQAMSLAIDREGVCQAAFGGACETATQPYPSDSVFFDADNPDEFATFDPEAARALVSEAGAEGAAFTIVTFTEDARWSLMAEVTQQMFQDVGLDAEVQALTGLEFFGAFLSGNAHVATLPTGPFLDPTYGMNFALRSASPANPGGYEHDGLEELLAAAGNELDEQARAELFQEMSSLVMEDVTYIPIMSENLIWAQSPRVQGFEAPGIMGLLNLRGVTVED